MVWKDFDVWDYHIVITNSGGLSNSLYKVNIALPGGTGVITNAVVLTNNYAARIVYGSGSILLDYGTSNTLVTNGGYDRIVIRGYNEALTPGTVGNWSISGANAEVDPATTASQDAGLIGQSVQLVIGDPGYNGEYYVSTTNLNTLSGTDALAIVVKNTGSFGNSITNVRIMLDYPLTNIVSIQTNNLGMAGSNVTSNQVEIYYGAGVFTNGLTDIIRLTAANGLVYGSTNFTVQAKAVYNRSGGKEKALAVNGGSDVVTLTTPAPSFYGYVDTADVNINRDYDFWDYHINVTNTGDSLNSLKKVRITLPGLTNYITNAVVVSNNIGAVITVSASNIVVDYTGSNRTITNGWYDRIVVRGYDGVTNSGVGGTWKIEGANAADDQSYGNGLDASAIGKSVSLNFVDPQYDSRYQLLSGNISTVVPVNEYRVNVRNTGITGNNITNVRLYLGYPLTNDSVTVSNQLGNLGLRTGITNGTNYVDVGYGAGVFTAGTNDTLYVTLKQTMAEGNTNSWISAGMIYNTSAGKVIGSLIVSGGVNTFNAVMPGTAFYGYVDAKDTTVQKDEDYHIYGIWITNVGAASNALYKVRLVPPGTNTVLTNVAVVSNVMGGNATVDLSGIIEIDYYTSNTSIGSGGYDRIWIKGMDNQTNGGFTGGWQIQGANRPSYVFSNTQNPADIGQSTNLSIVDPGYEVQYYLGTTNVSVFVPDNAVNIALNNTGKVGYNNVIGKVRLYIPTPFVTNGAALITNRLNVTGFGVGSDGIGNYAELTYASNVFGLGSNDVVTLNLRQTLGSGSFTTNLNLAAEYYTSAGKFTAGKVNGGVNSISILNPGPSPGGPHPCKCHPRDLTVDKRPLRAGHTPQKILDHHRADEPHLGSLRRISDVPRGWWACRPVPVRCEDRGCECLRGSDLYRPRSLLHLAAGPLDHRRWCSGGTPGFCRSGDGPAQP